MRVNPQDLKSLAPERRCMSLETVLLAIDAENLELTGAVARTTADIAGPAGAAVVLGHVFTGEGYERARERLNFSPDSEVTPDVIAERNVDVREFGEALSTVDVDVRARGRLCDDEDDRGEAFVGMAEDVGADLLVVGGEGRSPAGKAVFGSMAQEILLTAPCPVTFVRGD